MRIGVTSDIHTDITTANRWIVKHLVNAAHEASLDVLVICGDVSPNLLELSRALLAFQELDCKKLFVAGNHDIWVFEKNVTSEQKYKIIDDICLECDFHHLGKEAFVIGQVGFCGTIGWYDYSFKLEKYEFSESQYARKRLYNSVWNDVVYAKWDCSDKELAHRFEMELQSQIDSIKDEVSHIAVVTHHLPFQESVIYRGELPWDFFSAFMGSKGLGKICVNEPLVKYALFGHSHFKSHQQINGITAICSPVGYLFNKTKKILPQYARDQLTVFEIAA